MFLPKPEGGDFIPVPSGTFPAVCTRFIDIGTQQSSFQGQIKHQRKVVLTWEIADPELKMDDGRPFTISSRYTWSMSEKASLRKLLEAWRGKKFQEKDFGNGGFDIKNILGKPCFISISHSEKDGKTYSNITGVVSVPKNYQIGELVNPLVYFSLQKEKFDRNVLESLSGSLQDTIKSSPEYKELTGTHKNNLDNEAPEEYNETNPPPFDDIVPF